VLQCVTVCYSGSALLFSLPKLFGSKISVFVAGCCSVLQCVVVCCSVLQRVAVCSSALQCVAVAVRCSGSALLFSLPKVFGSTISVFVAVCCSVSWCVAACCSVLQCVAVCCSVLQWQCVAF